MTPKALVLLAALTLGALVCYQPDWPSDCGGQCKASYNQCACTCERQGGDDACYRRCSDAFDACIQGCGGG